MSVKRENPSIQKISNRIEKISDSISSLERRIGEISIILLNIQATERASFIRTKKEQLPERIEQSLGENHLNQIRGRHREVLALFVNEGFHTYNDIARKLSISQSRARAYVTELKNNFKIPLRHLRDPEGYKVGIDFSFVEKVLNSSEHRS